MPTELRYEVAPDGDLIVHVPMQWKKTSKRTVALTSDESLMDTPLAQTAGRALVWKEQLERGDFPSAKAMALALGYDPSYFRHVLNIAFMSPRILKSVYTGQGLPADLSVARLMRVQSLVWDEQERELGFSAGA